MSDLKLNPDTDDVLFVQGDLVLTSGIEALTQRIETSLRMFLGEAFESPLEGVPYLEKILVKNPPLSTLTGLFRRAILLVDGVTSIESLNLDFEPIQRTLSLSFTIRGDLGEQITLNNFVVNV